jgi:hypothetical protein
MKKKQIIPRQDPFECNALFAKIKWKLNQLTTH